MPDYDDMGPGTDLLNEGISNVASDRARRINSLHRTVDDLVQEQNKKRLQISSEVSSLTKQQQKMMVELELERGEFTNETAQAYSGVLKGLGRTINSLATGVKNITADTGRATTQAIGQYGKAISEDISINKTNTIAMSLSRATPLFGYFAAKFMETDVFRDAAGKIKDRVGSAMKEGLSKAGSGIANIFRKGKIAEEEYEDQPATVHDLQKLQKNIEGGIPPKLQEGGYIKEGGMIQVHAAEVVTPIDKLLEQIDQAKSADIATKLDKTLSLMSQNMMKLETVVVEREEQRGFVGKNIAKTFMEEFQRARDRGGKGSYERRLLKAIVELKVGLIGMTSRMRIAWQRTLLQHPTFRNMLMFSEMMQSAIITPLRFLFGVRGGYAGDVRKATGTHNVFAKISNLLGMTYSTLMPKIDDLVIYTRAAAEALTGETISPSKEYTYTAFGKIKEFMTSRDTTKGDMFGSMTDRLGLDKKAMEEAGIKDFKDLLHPFKIMKEMGMTKENIKGKMFEGAGVSADENPIYKKYKSAKGKAQDLWSDIAKNISELRDMKADQEKREGPHSPSMAQNIANTAVWTEGAFDKTKEAFQTAKERFKEYKDKMNIREKLEKYSTKLKEKGNTIADKGTKIAKETYKETKGVRASIKKTGSKIWDYLLIGFGFIKNLFGSMVGKITKFFGPILQFFGIKAGVKGIAGGVAKQGIAGAAGGAAKKGLLGRGLGMAGKALGFGAKVGAVGASGVIGMGMGAWDAIQAMRDPEGFMGNFLTRGLSGFLGGTDSGLKGATSGALKGGAIGAAATAWLGPGALIGGAIGAAAGAVLGFVGGKNISKAISAVVDGIKKLAEGVWNIVMFPVKALKEGLKSSWTLLKWGLKMTLGKLWTSFKEWLEKPGLIQKVMKVIIDLGYVVTKVLTAPFIAIGKKLKELVTGDLWVNLWTSVKGGFMSLVGGFVGAFQWLKDKVVEKISGIPIIGKIFRAAMGVVKDIHEGTLASKLESALNETGGKKSPLGTVPGSVANNYKGSGVKDLAQNIGTDLIDRVMETETTKLRIEQESRKRSREGLEGMKTEISNGSKRTTAAIINNTNMISSTSSNNISGGGGLASYGQGWGQFASGNAFAADVTRCNIQ